MIGRHRMTTPKPPGGKLVRDWVGKRVKTVREMSNGWCTIASGTICTVDSVSGGTGLSLVSDPCSCCGVKVRISRIHATDVEVIA